MAVTGSLLPIGQFARLCRLSLKQLRHYDEVGLLPPARVDPHTGYRYYHPEQARTALSIGLLRSLDVPLPVIARVLDTGVDALDGVRDTMEADLARRRRVLATLTRVLADGLPVADVRLSREPSRRVVAVRGSGAVADVSTVTSRCAEQLTAALTAAGARPVGTLVGRFPLDLSDEFTVTMAAEVDTAVPDTEPDLLPGGLFAVATHVGPYDQITLTAHALLAWIGQHGHVPVGELREVYVSDPRTHAGRPAGDASDDQDGVQHMNERYDAPDEPELTEFGPVTGLAVSGRGAPGAPEHAMATRSLYAVASSLLGGLPGVGMPPLEGRWWVEDDRPALAVPRDEWRWHLFLRVAVPASRLPLRGLPPAAARVQVTTFTEGQVVHVMHHGPFADEPRTLARMEAYMDKRGLVADGLHHEVYLSDPFTPDQATMRTILRQPVRAA